MRVHSGVTQYGPLSVSLSRIGNRPDDLVELRDCLLDEFDNFECCSSDTAGVTREARSWFRGCHANYSIHENHFND